MLGQIAVEIMRRTGVVRSAATAAADLHDQQINARAAAAFCPRFMGRRMIAAAMRHIQIRHRPCDAPGQIRFFRRGFVAICLLASGIIRPARVSIAAEPSYLLTRQQLGRISQIAECKAFGTPFQPVVEYILHRHGLIPHDDARVEHIAQIDHVTDGLVGQWRAA